MASSSPETAAESPTSDCYLESCAVSAAGAKKDVSEDSILNLSEYGIFCIAGGIGGGSAGKKASTFVAEGIEQQCWDTSFDSEEVLITTLKEAVSRAKVRIQRFARSQNLDGVGATVVILHLNPMKGTAFILYAGDCRVYQLRDKTLTQLTKDHSMGGDLGLSGGDDISHIIQDKLTRAVGLFDKVNLESQSIELHPNDVFLLCSSGLHSTLNDDEITDILKRTSGDGVESAANKLLEEAKQRQPPDDVSVLLAKVVSEMPVGGTSQNKGLFAVLAAVVVIALVVAGLLYFGKNSTTEAEEGHYSEVAIPADSKTSPSSTPIENAKLNAQLDDRSAENAPSTPISRAKDMDPERSQTESDTRNAPTGLDRQQLENGISTPLNLESASDRVETKADIVDGQPESPDPPQSQRIPSTSVSTASEDQSAPEEKGPLAAGVPDVPTGVNGNATQNESESITDNEPSLQKKPSVTISDPKVGTTHMLVETYSDGRMEVSKLSDKEYKLVTEKLQASSPSSLKTDAPKVPDEVKKPTVVTSAQASTNRLNTPETFNDKGHTSKSDTDATTATAVHPKKEPDEIDDFLNELTDISGRWDTLPAQEKDKLGKRIVLTLSMITDNDKAQNYRNGNRVQRVFKQAEMIGDSKLQNSVNELKFAYAAEFASDLKTGITQAQETCDWTAVNNIFQENSEISQELQELDMVKAARSWCRLTIPVRNDLRYLRDYTNRLVALSAKLDPLTSMPENLDFDPEDIVDDTSKSPLELCEHFTYFNEQTRTRLLDATDRLALNLGIISHESLTRLVEFTYPGGMRFSLYDRKLEFVQDGLKMLTDIKDNLSAVEKWALPEEQLTQFEDDLKKLLVLYYRIQHHLRFLKEMLDEYKQVSQRTSNDLLTDSDLPDEYIEKFNEGNTIFSTEDARELQYRFTKSIVVENDKMPP